MGFNNFFSELLFGSQNNMNKLQLNSANSDKTPNKVIIYKSELEYISRCILDYPHLETGGNLFGFFTTFSIPIIHYVIGPGHSSTRSATHFIQDESFFDANADQLIKEHALHHIGTWHSHHKLEINQPSGGDASSMFDGMREDNLKSFLLIIGNIHRNGASANAYRFSAGNRNYVYCPWVILDEVSPIRYQFDRKHRNIIHIPQTSTAVVSHIQSVPLRGEAIKKISYSEGYWLNDASNKEELKKIVDYLKSKYRNVSFYLQEEDQTLKITIQDRNHWDIIFPNEFPNIPPLIYIDNQKLNNSNWEKKGSISQIFIKYLSGKEISYDR